MTRSAWIRFTLFAALVTAMAAYVYSRWPLYLQSRGPTAAQPATAPAPPAWGGAPPAPGAPVRAGAAPGPAGAAGKAPGVAGIPTGAAGAGPTADPALAEGDFFAEFRLERDRAHAQEREMLERILQAGGDDQARREAQARYLALSRAMGLEAALEALIRGRGYADAVVMITGDSAQVVVRAPALDARQAAHLADLVRQVAGVRPQAVQVVARER